MEALIRSARLAPRRTRLGAASMAAPAAVESITSAEREQAAALAAARAEIEQRVRAELTAQLEQLGAAERERARSAGLAAAVSEAQAAAAQQLAEQRRDFEQRVVKLVATLEQAHQAALSRVEASVAEVAFAAVCRLVTQRAADRDFVLGLIEQLCTQLRAETSAVARLHPRDVELLSELLVEHELRLPAVGLKVIADASLQLGGCVIEATSGRYDGGLEQQLRRLHAVLGGAD